MQSRRIRRKRRARLVTSYNIREAEYMPTKRQARAKHITGHSITLTDAKGKARIHMDAGNGDGLATICLFGESGRSIQISTSPDGGIYISLLGQRCKVSATLGMTADESAGLTILDRRGRLGSMLGAVFDSKEHRLVVFRVASHIGVHPERQN